MIQWNSGSLFARRFESDSNAIRRFLVANNLKGSQDWRKIPRETDSRITKAAAIAVIRETQGEAYWRSHPWLFRANWRVPEKSLFQCPECAKGYFHTYAYSYLWLNRCPLHGADLIEVCPECERPWASELSVLQREGCWVCGTRRPPSRQSRARQMRPHQAADSRILSALWAVKAFDPSSCHILYYDFVSNGMDPGVRPEDPFYPDFFSNAPSDYLAMLRPFVTRSSEPIQCEYSLGPLARETVEKENGRLPAIPTYARIAAGTMVKELEAALNAFGLTFSREELESPIYVDWGEDIIPSKLAFRIWRSIMLQEEDGVCFAQSWSRLFTYSGMHVPCFPPIDQALFEPRRKQYFVADKAFSLWLFSNNAKTLYDHIFRHLARLRYEVSRASSIETKAGMQPPYLSSRTFRDFRLMMGSGNRLIVIGKPMPSFRDIVDFHLKKKTGLTSYVAVEADVFRRFQYLQSAPDLTTAIARDADYLSGLSHGAVPGMTLQGSRHQGIGTKKQLADIWSVQ